MFVLTYTNFRSSEQIALRSCNMTYWLSDGDKERHLCIWRKSFLGKILPCLRSLLLSLHYETCSIQNFFSVISQWGLEPCLQSMIYYNIVMVVFTPSPNNKSKARSFLNVFQQLCNMLIPTLMAAWLPKGTFFVFVTIGLFLLI